MEDTQKASYEYNSDLGIFKSFFGDCWYDCPITAEDLSTYVRNPMEYNEELRSLAWWAYRSNGSIGTTVDYMRTMHTLDGVVVCKSRTKKNKKLKRFEENRLTLLSTLDKIRYKQVIRDNLLKDANDGIYFGYLEVTNKPINFGKTMSDTEILNLVDINEAGINASVICLPVDYCRIIGRKNGSPVVAFDLRYFRQCSQENLKNILRTFPKEIQKAWDDYGSGKSYKDWIVLDNDHTITTKIKSGMNDPCGIPISISALRDALYENDFIKTKSSVLNRLNNQIIYETFPEGEKGKCALSEKGQKDQHKTLKNALNTKSSAGGRIFCSLAAGTKLNAINIPVDIFDSKNESNIKDAIPADMGISSSVLSGNTTGNYATAKLNLELVSGNIFSWICEFMDELNKCINKTIIKDDRCIVEFKILPITFVNRDSFFKYMETLYTQCGGSLQALIAASGMDVEGYISMMDYERQNNFDKKYAPHVNPFTTSNKNKEGGRPSDDSSGLETTIGTKTNGSNIAPKPSTD